MTVPEADRIRARSTTYGISWSWNQVWMGLDDDDDTVILSYSTDT